MCIRDSFSFKYVCPAHQPHIHGSAGHLHNGWRDGFVSAKSMRLLPCSAYACRIYCWSIAVLKQVHAFRFKVRSKHIDNIGTLYSQLNQIQQCFGLYVITAHILKLHVQLSKFIISKSKPKTVWQICVHEQLISTVIVVINTCVYTPWMKR